MINENYALWEKGEYKYEVKGDFIPNLVTYIHNDDNVRPAIIIVPGGGYRIVTPLEGEIVAKEFYKNGYNAFVLTYTTNWLLRTPLKFQPLQDLSKAVRLIRKEAEQFHIDSEKLILCGFSAGGHLCGSLAVHYDAKELKLNNEYDCYSNRPNAAILCYPVISSSEYVHRGSFTALLGENATRDELEYMSLEKHITKNTPPVFLWHSVTDNSVPVENSYLLAKSCKKQGVVFEQHIFANGVHGMSLANEEWATGDYGKDYTMEQLFETAEFLLENHMELPEPYKNIREIPKGVSVRDLIIKEKIRQHVLLAESDEGIAVWPKLACSWVNKVLNN
ncbi:alpha/beta hydrolase [Clostridium sp. HBUAS56017]|uniref:Alpha/beta hydrolase n=2 Tax=Clostridium cibarium TaxID=2762247 RepID=A0ABR8PYF1_9CLOT|nr:alpha/beta hydrolase [Clostridium sp. HBUAS56017]MBD7913184.1 alpha/beta hydrolase [Clostridium cibarium]